MKIKLKKIYFMAVLVILMLSSCAAKPTLEQRLTFIDKTVVKAALTEMWRTNKSEYIMNIVNLLSDSFLYEDAAFTLSAFGSDTMDKVVANRMSGAKNNTGYLLYFLFRCRETGYNEKIRALVKDAAKLGDWDAAGDFIYAAISGDYENAISLFTKACGIKSGQKEFIIMLGNEKISATYGFLQKLSEPDFKPLATWGMHKIKPVNKIKPDNADRVITDNPYWKKYGKDPVLPSVSGTFKAWHTANPDILVENGMIYFYYRGGDGHDRMAVATSPYESFDGLKLIDYPNNPIINLGTNSFDDLAVLDPGAVYFNKQVFLYYSGLGTGDDAVGLATSKDFYNFTKYKKNPVLPGRAPEVLIKDGIIYMYYVKPNGYGGYSIYLATSDDGYIFIPYGSEPVFVPGKAGEWDSKTVTVPRIREKDGIYYMFYAGDNKYMDYPPYFGVAFSYDLVNWYRGTQNPIFSRGKKGDWDDGGIWYAEVFPYKNRLFMYYEGWGGAESHDKEYGAGGHSQIGLAVSDFNLEDLL